MSNLKTVKEAAAELRCSPKTVYAMCAAKAIRHHRVGGRRGKLLIPADAITEYLAAGTVTLVTIVPAAPRVTKKPKLKHLRLPS